MASTLADALSESIIALICGSDCQISLHSADPGKTGANEITGTGYARQTVLAASGWNAAAADGTTGGRVRTNVGVVDYGTAGSAWGTVSHFGVYIGGVYKGGAPLTSTQTVASGNDVQFAAGTLAIVGAGF